MPEKNLRVKKLGENESTISVVADEVGPIKKMILVQKKDSELYRKAEAIAKERDIPVEQYLAELFSHGI